MDRKHNGRIGEYHMTDPHPYFHLSFIPNAVTSKLHDIVKHNEIQYYILNKTKELCNCDLFFVTNEE